MPAVPRSESTLGEGLWGWGFAGRAFRCLGVGGRLCRHLLLLQHRLPAQLKQRALALDKCSLACLASCLRPQARMTGSHWRQDSFRYCTCEMKHPYRFGGRKM